LFSADPARDRANRPGHVASTAARPTASSDSDATPDGPRRRAQTSCSEGDLSLTRRIDRKTSDPGIPTDPDASGVCPAPGGCASAAPMDGMGVRAGVPASSRPYRSSRRKHQAWRARCRVFPEPGA